MADFQRNSSPPNYLGRRQQRRLLMLVLSLGLILVLMHEAGKPSNWLWMWGGAPPTVDERESDSPPTDAPRREISTGGEPAVSLSQAGRGDVARTERRWFPGVTPELLASVRDDTTFRSREHEAFFHLLGILDRADAAELTTSSRGPVSFVQLADQPDVYRGELVRVEGVVRRALPLAAAPNERGVERYFQLWLQPSERPDALIVVYCLRLPDEFPTGMAVEEPTALTGFFFKRWAYKAQDTIRTAPLVLAKQVAWRPAAPSVGIDPPTPPTSAGIVVFAAAAVAALLILLAIGRRGRRRAASTASTDRLPENIELSPSVRESLSVLAARDGFAGESAPVARGGDQSRAD